MVYLTLLFISQSLGSYRGGVYLLVLILLYSVGALFPTFALRLRMLAITLPPKGSPIYGYAWVV